MHSFLRTLPVFLLSLLAASGLRAATQEFQIDPVHSSVSFTIRHIVSKVPGRFTKFSGTIVVDRDNMENNQVDATIEVASVNTSNDRRDNHLKSPDFFNAAEFPTMHFRSRSWKKTGEDTYDVTGDLTIKNTTHAVTLKTTSLGFAPGMQGGQVSGWEATTAIKKSDYGVNGPAMLAKVVGDDVAITIQVEADAK